MVANASLKAARELMAQFATETGLPPSEGEPRRYLWTDAFAVCNYLALHRRTQEPKYLDLALRLVEQVHQILGRHRPDDPRTGWISGLEEEEGARHPTAGGLRIGKKNNERSAEEVLNERLEWERDGQYFHYLTKWMHALHQVSLITGDPTFLNWATEMAKTAHARFTFGPEGRRSMYWKMSIDLSYPLVSSMGQHDPLDGLVTCRQLQAAAVRASVPENDLKAEIADLAEICRGTNLATADPLGIGGLLFDACRMAQLRVRGEFEESGVLEATLEAARLGLESFATRNPFRLPSEYRLAFRELGLSIGLKAADILTGLVGSRPELFGGENFLTRKIDPLARYAPFAGKIDDFWSDPGNRQSEGWLAHREINTVMLATSLLPAGFIDAGGNL